MGEHRLFRKSLSKKRDELEGTVQKYGPPYVEVGQDPDTRAHVDVSMRIMREYNT